MVLPSLAHGGAQKVFLEIASFLANQDYPVVLISLDRSGELIDRIPEALEVVYLDGGFSLPGVLKRGVQWFRLRRFIYGRDIHRIISTVTGMNLFLLSCFYFNKQVRVTVREATSFENLPNIFSKLMLRVLYRRSDRIICTSQYIKEQLIGLGVTNESKAIVLPNPIDFEWIYSKSEMAPSVDVKKETHQYLVVAVGRLIKAKGFDVLITAFKNVSDVLSAKLVIIGDGPEYACLCSLIKQMGLGKDVALIGYQHNPYPFIKMADLFVLSSRWEGYVNVVIEAMALGVDVVATDCRSGPGELLQHELGYQLVAVDDANALATAIVNRLNVPKDCTVFAGLLKPNELSSAIHGYL